MRTIPPGFLDGPITDLAACWKIVRRDSIEILGTEYDQNIDITTGDYVGLYLAHAGITGSDIRTTADMAVDNLEVRGALADATAPDSSDTSDTGDTGSLFLVDLTAADLEAGLFDNADVTTFLVNATDPDLYQHVLRTGWIGSTTRTAEGEYRAEVRGLTQALSQGVVRTYSLACDAELGDARCSVDMTTHTTTSDVASVTISRRSFVYSGGSLAAFGQVPGGEVIWLSGQNTGYRMEIKTHDAGTQTLTLFQPMPLDIAPGDDFSFRAGCDKSKATCKDVYANLVNRRAHAVFVPGDLQILKVGKR